MGLSSGTAVASCELLPCRSDGPQWYAVHTFPRHEKRVAEHLRVRSIEAFLPLYRCNRRWKNGLRAELDLPLFPGYLFTRLSRREWTPVLMAPSVVTLVGSRGRPNGIPEGEIETIRCALKFFKVEPHPFLAAGDRVRIIAGPLDGVEGLLVRRKQDFRVVLTVNVLMRSMSVEVDMGAIAKIPSAAEDRAN
jgi:transcription termination/antitermination protein NusG